MDSIEEIEENIHAIEKLLEYANIPEKYILRIIMSYVMICTGSVEEKNAFYLSNHMDNSLA